MPTKHETYSYKFAELDETAQERAVTAISDKLAGDWWDDNDNERVADAMVYTFADRLKAPGWQDFGEVDFPGIEGVKLQGWDLYRNRQILFDGILTRENAPGLGWVPGIESVQLIDNRYSTKVEVEQGDIGFACAQCGALCVGEAGNVGHYWHALVVPGGYVENMPLDEDHEPEPIDDLDNRDEAGQMIKDEVENAIEVAFEAGQAEADYIGGTENAREWIDSNEPDFNEDGSIF